MSNGKVDSLGISVHLFTMPIDPEFEWLINAYLADVFRDTSPHKGWKIPETTLVYPWIATDVPGYKVHPLDPGSARLYSVKPQNGRPS